MQQETLVVALGGNALLKRGETLDAAVQRANVAVAAKALSAAAREFRLVVTHGNGPQIGLLSLQNSAYTGVAPYPLDVLGAETEGMIGYVLDQHLANNLPGREVATLLTQVVVDPEDPAMLQPTKPIGPGYDVETVRHLTARRGWTMVADGKFWRRAVPSPMPKEIVELPVIRLLSMHDVIVVCSGGGGIPVVRDGDGLRGIEAVIDQDATSSLLARGLDATRLVLLTDVPGVATGWTTDRVHWLRTIAPDALRELPVATGSMGPKIRAACDFVEATGRHAEIGSLDVLPAILAGHAGTTVRLDAPTSWYHSPAA